MSLTLEVCVGSLADIETAAAAGADRVELCGGLELGGLTPSLGLVEQALAAAVLPVVVMVRPRAGGFCYDRHEFAVMLRDAERIAALGAAGIAFGLLDAHRRVDEARTRDMAAAAGNCEAVFHRAFDFAADRASALDALIGAGCRRVLTSGGRATALEGIDALDELVRRAGERIAVMAGGSIGPHNIRAIIDRTGCTQIHIGAAGPSAGANNEGGGPPLVDDRFLRGGGYRVVDRQLATATIGAARHVDGAPDRGLLAGAPRGALRRGGSQS